ncbi:LysM domain-containing protein, partial [Desulfurobacterium sp.]
MKILKSLIKVFIIVLTISVTATASTYIVKKGDSLNKIAEKFGTTTTEIILSNKLKPPYVIYPGQRLVIPERYKIYRVRKGDSLNRIARKFGVSL